MPPMPKQPLNLTPEQIKNAFQNSMWYEIVYTFGVPEHNPFDYCVWEMINFSRMGHARVLYTFLETPKERRFKDDVLAVDFGYPAETIKLSGEDRERLNKDLFHFSYGRLRHNPTTNKRWPNSIISNLHEPVLKFMKYVASFKQDLFEPHPKTSIADWQGVISLLESGKEMRIRCYQNRNDESRYIFETGRTLPEGKPILTPLLSYDY